MNMANTSAVYARIDTKLKENAEGILFQFCRLLLNIVKLQPGLHIGA